MTTLPTNGNNDTIFFPITANPIGHHHLLLAESILWHFQKTKTIVFLLSNGFHPDPLKGQEIPQTRLRVDILMNALEDWNDPEKSMPAKLALKEGFILKLKNNNCAISRYEFSFNRPIRLSEHIQFLSGKKKVPIVLGAKGESYDLFIKNQQCGVSFFPEDENDLARVVTNLSVDKKFRDKLGKTGKRYVYEYFNRKELTKSFLYSLNNG